MELSYQNLEQSELFLQVAKKVACFKNLKEQRDSFIKIVMEIFEIETASIFLNDKSSNELYTTLDYNEKSHELRFLNTEGIAGEVFTSNENLIVNNVADSQRFNPAIDKKTGFTTQSILCIPIRTPSEDVIGVVELINKIDADFNKGDLQLLEGIVSQVAISLQGAITVETLSATRRKEMDFLDVVINMTSELNLGNLLQKVMSEAVDMLNAERSTLFLNDEKTSELFARVAQGSGIGEIRFPNHIGIAGTVFQSSETINIPYAYADLRFNPAFDKQTGFFTRSILCVPLINMDGKCIGATQILNKHGGPFTDEDESRLRAFTAQIAIALENAKLFHDVQNMRNYNESILESMSSGVLTIDDNGTIITCNKAGIRILQGTQQTILGSDVNEIFQMNNHWIIDKIEKVEESEKAEITMDGSLEFEPPFETLSVNVTVYPLISIEDEKLGYMLMLEDISVEKRTKATMARYMDPALADQLLESGTNILGGSSVESTVLFSDIRGFTTITEQLGAQGTVSLLNEYFTIMVDCIEQNNGMLDKFIGDAIMAVFGIPRSHEDDPDRALKTAISMLRRLDEWNITRIAQKKPPVNIGIGLNTGQVVSGNIGSPNRMDYTIIGDGVNLAARLESACKQYNTKILISENTRLQLQGSYRLRSVDDVIVKGKTKPVEVFEVMDFYTDEQIPHMMEVIGYFQEARKNYKNQQWEKSIALFNKVLKICPSDQLSEQYIHRCQSMQQEPVKKDWDGVWTMTSK